MNIVGTLALIRRDITRMFRVSIQTLITPWITALLYIFIFGFVIGRRINLLHGVSYIDFVLPGIIMMNIIMSSFSQASSSLYFQRFMKSFEEILISPLSYFEIIIGFLAGGILRGLIVGLGVYVIALYFTTATISHFWLFIFYSIAVSAVFSLVGMLVGLFANHFEHLAILNTFVIMPLVFLGGVFNPISLLPSAVQNFVRLNPFFYFVDGIRFAMIGIREANPLIGVLIIFGLIFSLGGLVWYLFKKGYKIK